jgi:hypothetical protein
MFSSVISTSLSVSVFFLVKRFDCTYVLVLLLYLLNVVLGWVLVVVLVQGEAINSQ